MITSKDIIEAFNFRHATKIFDSSKKISKDNFDTILEAGRLSPSSFGMEPWRFLVIQNQELRNEMKSISWGAQTQLPTCSHYLAILCHKDGMRYNGEHVQHMIHNVQQLSNDAIEKRYERFMNFQQEKGLLENPRFLFDWSVQQSYIAMGNMMTVAAMLGIDSCAIEGMDYPKMEQLLDEHGLLDNGKYGVSVMIAFGYRLNQPRKKTRQPLSDIVQWIN